MGFALHKQVHAIPKQSMAISKEIPSVLKQCSFKLFGSEKGATCCLLKE